jgi:hypothetical protein
MAEITANFGSKDITITYPDSLLGKAGEALSFKKRGLWVDFLEYKNANNPTEAELMVLKNEFVVFCLLDYIKNMIKDYEINKEIDSAHKTIEDTVDSILGQINMKITESPSGPEYV